MKPLAVFDTEIYRDYFLVVFKNLATGNVVTLERTPEQDLDIYKVLRIMASYTLVGFNSNHFDLPVLAVAMTGADNETIKAVCDSIIVGKQIIGHAFEDLDHIDIIEVAPGFLGLKQYGARLHARTIQDLPIEPGASITPEMRETLRTYCINDLALTEELYQHLLPQIQLRRTMGSEYLLDLRSKSDAQIAEAVIKKEVEARIGKRIYRSKLAPNTKLTYTPPEWIRFVTATGKTVLNAVTESEYLIDSWGSPVLPQRLAECAVGFNDTYYTLGIGGLHSTEKSVAHHADDQHILIDRDVASYYPSLILGMGLAPANMGEHFLPVYRGIVERRLAAKHAGDTVTADSLKICVNGSFGKLGSKWSVLYAPHLMLQVTLTGQLALLMLIEQLEQHRIHVVSANTDGIVIKCRRAQVAEMDAIVEWWETTTSLATEATEYLALYSKDVNNYIALKPGGKVKAKGLYAPASLAKQPSCEIAVEAVIAKLQYGSDIGATIRACTDIRKFLNIRGSKGGAYKDGRYLGKVARWYYSTRTTTPITDKDGSTVARSAGGMPCMTLPDTLPGDIDFAWYFSEAKQILEDIGYANTTPRVPDLLSLADAV